jgi:hypothetical protein
LKTDLDAVQKTLPGKIIVYEAGNCPNTFKSMPHHHIFRAIAAVQSNNVAPLDPEVMNHPIADSRNAVEELCVCPLAIFEYEKYLVWSIAQCLIFKDMESEQAISSNLLLQESLGRKWIARPCEGI